MKKPENSNDPYYENNNKHFLFRLIYYFQTQKDNSVLILLRNLRSMNKCIVQ